MIVAWCGEKENILEIMNQVSVRLNRLGGENTSCEISYTGAVIRTLFLTIVAPVWRSFAGYSKAY